MKTGARQAWIFIGFAALFAVCVVGLPFIGLERVSWQDVWAGANGQAAQIFWQLRLPRVVAGVLAGVVLSISGLAFQALFRNPLATPFTLGTASGASLGASFYIWSGWSFALLGISGQTFCGLFGALLALGLIYGLSRRRGGFPTEIMLLAGVAIGFLFSSIILLLQYLANQAHSLRILRWLMGGLDMVGYGPVLEALPFALFGVGTVVYLRVELNLLSLGEDLAAGRGVDLRRVKILLLSAVGMMVGAVVAFAGPVGFVGMMVPHVARLLLGPDHRRLVPATILLGGAFLPLCDAVARVIIAPAELPVGIITALLGGPFFIWLLVSKTRTKL